MWTIVARFTSVGEAESARSALDAAGIEARVQDENMVAVDWLMSQAVGGVKLLVPAEEREAAAEVLSAAAQHDATFAAEELSGWEASASEAEPAVRKTAEACPACGSADVQPIPRLKIFAAVSVIAICAGAAAGQMALSFTAIAVVGFVVAMLPSHRCNACGEKWTPDVEAPAEPFGPLPEAAENLDPHCPRCGSSEYHHVTYRRFGAASLLFSLWALLLLPVWLLLPKWKCDSCGLRRWSR